MAKTALPIVMLPVRAADDMFAATVYPTLPLPVPVCPNETVIQSALAAAERAHVLALAVTAIVPLPPEAATLALAGLIEKEQVWA